VYNIVHNISRELNMKTATFTEFRNHAGEYFDIVEKGEEIQIIRNGKPIAEIYPYKKIPLKIPSWKRPGLKLKIDGISLSDTILSNRKMAKT